MSFLIGCKFLKIQTAGGSKIIARSWIESNNCKLILPIEGGSQCKTTPEECRLSFCKQTNDQTGKHVKDVVSCCDVGVRKIDR